MLNLRPKPGTARGRVGALALPLLIATAMAGVPASASADGVEACVAGGMYYLDQNGIEHPSSNVEVHVLDRGVFSDDLIATGNTGTTGRYKLCFDNNDDGTNAGGQDVSVILATRNKRARVQGADGEPYTLSVDGPSNVANGSTTELGNRQPPAKHMRGWHAFDEVNDAWNFVPDRGANNCWDARDAAANCRKVVVNWAPNSTLTDGYAPAANQVNLSTAAPDARHVVVHEVAHAIMDDVYEDVLPVGCPGHEMAKASTAGCAWSEGFATWFAASAYGDPIFRWADGLTNDLENKTWTTSDWDDGDKVEGRVAGALIDIADDTSGVGDTWDRAHEGVGNIWTTFLNHVDGTFAQFWTDRARDFDVAPTGATMASLYQNTIDYGFNEQLKDYVPRVRPVPIVPHRYEANTTTNYWSVVAARPTISDYSLDLYDTATGAGLTQSTEGNDTVDFIAIDSNAGGRPLGSYLARVKRASDQSPDGQGDYSIELAQGSQQLNAGLQTISMRSSDVAAVRDLRLAKDQVVTITVQPTAFGQDPEVFLMARDPADPIRGSVRPRAAAAASASAQGPIVKEVISNFKAPYTGWYGFVLLQKYGSPSGSYQVTVS